MIFPTPSCRPRSEASRFRSSLSVTDTRTSLRPISSDSSNSRSVPSPFRMSARLSVAASACPRAGSRSMTRSSISGAASRSCARRNPISPPPMMVTSRGARATRRRSAPKMRPCSALIGPRVPMRTTLSPASSRVGPRGIVVVSPCLTATITTPGGKSEEATNPKRPRCPWSVASPPRAGIRPAGSHPPRTPRHRWRPAP